MTPYTYSAKRYTDSYTLAECAYANEYVYGRGTTDRLRMDAVS